MSCLLLQEGAEALPPGSRLVGLALFVGVGLFLSPLAVRLVSRGETPPSPPVTWGLREVGWAFVAGLLGVLALGGVFRLVGATGIVGGLYGSQAILASALAGGWLAVRRTGTDTAAAFGITRRGALDRLLPCLLGYVLTFPLLLGVNLAWTMLASALGKELAPQEVLVGILELDGPGLAQALVLAVLVAPALEEALFRGFLQPALIARTGGTGRGVALTAFLFGALHGPAALPQIFTLSLLLGLVRVRTGSTVLAYAVHAAHNGLQLFLALRLGPHLEGFS